VASWLEGLAEGIACAMLVLRPGVRMFSTFTVLRSGGEGHGLRLLWGSADLEPRLRGSPRNGLRLGPAEPEGFRPAEDDPPTGGGDSGEAGVPDIEGPGVRANAE
jgi:hypothetical protein